MGCECGECGPSISIEENVFSLSEAAEELSITRNDSSVAVIENDSRLFLGEEKVCVLLDGEEVEQCNLFVDATQKVALVEGDEVLLLDGGDSIALFEETSEIKFETLCGSFANVANVYGVQEVYVQDDEPTVLWPSLWVQTGLGPLGEDFTFRFWDPNG